MATESQNLVEENLESLPDLDFYTIRTPEMVDFSFQLAGPGARFLAWLFDSILIVILMIILAIFFMIVGLTLSFVAGSAGWVLLAIFSLIWFILENLYSIYFEVRWNGQTPGKRALGLRVIGDNGARLTLNQSVIRNLLRSFDRMPVFCYVLGVVSMAVTRHNQRIGDVLAGTIVIREETRPLPEELKLPQPKYNTLLNDVTFVVRCGRVINPEERELLVEVVQRRDELSGLNLETRSRLFEVLANHFRSRLMLQKDEKFVSDEKWILNLTQVLLESERRTLVS